MARRGRTHFGCSRPATAQPFPNRRDAENSPVATCLDPSSMALLVAAGASGEQFQLDAGFAIGVINGDALHQLGSALHSRPMAGPGSVLEPSCADLFRASHAFPLGCFPPLGRQAGPRLHVALDRRSNFTSPPSRGRRQGEGVFGRARVPGSCRNSARAGSRCRRSRPAVSPCVEYRRSGKRELATPTPTRWDNDQTAGRVIPQASQPCAGRRNRSFQTANGSPAGRLGFGRGTTTA
jgi:hypothetical protein